jgi:hypothetical protein
MSQNSTSATKVSSTHVALGFLIGLLNLLLGSLQYQAACGFGWRPCGTNPCRPCPCRSGHCLPACPDRARPPQATIDGEVVVVHEGRTNFSELQADLAAGRQDRLVYYVFELLWRDGDLRKVPQIERKQALRDILDENGVEAPVVSSEHLMRR